MESTIDKVLNDVITSPNNIGCLIANNQGLCIEKRGNISSNAAGMMVAILEQASKLEPNSNPPIVKLESGLKACLIHKHGVTGVVYTEMAKPSSSLSR